MFENLSDVQNVVAQVECGWAGAVMKSDIEALRHFIDFLNTNKA